MRKIKFRGNDFRSKWVFGDLLHKRYTVFATHMIEDSNGLGSDVKPETIGQFTGVLDKNGVEIYEGDIITLTRYAGSFARGLKQVSSTHTVVWEPDLMRFGLSNKSENSQKFRVIPSYTYEVIGNIFDNN